MNATVATDRAERKRLYFSTAEPQAQKERRDPKEVKEQAEAMSVAAINPDRRGNTSQRAGTALGRFWLRHRLHEKLFLAGEDYAAVVRADRLARGFNVAGSRGEPEFLSLGLTDKQIAAIREAATMQRAKWDGVLIGVHDRCRSAVESVCCDDRDPDARNEAVIKQGLYRLARDCCGFQVAKDA